MNVRLSQTVEKKLGIHGFATSSLYPARNFALKEGEEFAPGFWTSRNTEQREVGRDQLHGGQ